MGTEFILITRTRLFFSDFLKDPAGAALKRATPALSSDRPKKSATASKPPEKWRLEAAPAPQHCF